MGVCEHDDAIYFMMFFFFFKVIGRSHLFVRSDSESE